MTNSFYHGVQHLRRYVPRDEEPAGLVGNNAVDAVRLPAIPFRLGFTDCGNTVRLGEYEAAADAILYEADPEYRSRLRAKRREEDRSFGACLRRLRLQRGLLQGDFGDVTAKTIARIERGETAAPHGKTLAFIAARLQVEPDDIMSY
jgi:hypothetical protein